jgi:acetate kinase
MLNRASGMVALAGMAGDVKAVRKAAVEGDEQAVLALKIFTRSVTKAIGGFCWLLGGLDAVVFTGGIGEHDVLARAEILAGLQSLGISLSTPLNGAATHGLRRISTSESKTAVFVVPAQEDLMIALHVDRMDRSQK